MHPTLAHVVCLSLSSFCAPIARQETIASKLSGAGILRASASTSVHPREPGQDGWVTFPIPSAYRGQIPLTFELHAEPPEALLDFHWTEREDGLNVLCEVHVAPPKEGAALRWESLVYVPAREPVELPLAKEPAAPDDSWKWLRSSGCVQKTDPGIVAKANELADGADDIESYVERVIAFTSSGRGRPRLFVSSLDARKALEGGGSCTSRANLAAALLRARGIPARTVAHLPTWIEKLYEHWLVEYWHPGAGWVWIEPSLGTMQPAPWTLAVINIATPEDEDRAFDEPIAHTGVMLGVPDLSVHKHSPSLLSGYEDERPFDSSGNWARDVMPIDGDAERARAFAIHAREAYVKLLADCKAGRSNRGCAAKMNAAVEAKNLDDVERALAR